MNKHEQTYWTVVSHELHEHSHASRIKQDAGSYNLISHENKISPNQIRQFERLKWLKWCKHLGGVTQSKKFHPLSLLGSTGPQTKWCPEWSKMIQMYWLSGWWRARWPWGMRSRVKVALPSLTLHFDLSYYWVWRGFKILSSVYIFMYKYVYIITYIYIHICFSSMCLAAFRIHARTWLLASGFLGNLGMLAYCIL